MKALLSSSVNSEGDDMISPSTQVGRSSLPQPISGDTTDGEAK